MPAACLALLWQLTWLAIKERVQVSVDADARLPRNQESKLHLLTSADKRPDHYHLPY